jgi:hypothetical protein
MLHLHCAQSLPLMQKRAKTYSDPVAGQQRLPRGNKGVIIQTDGVNSNSCSCRLLSFPKHRQQRHHHFLRNKHGRLLPPTFHLYVMFLNTIIDTTANYNNISCNTAIANLSTIAINLLVVAKRMSPYDALQFCIYSYNNLCVGFRLP